MDIPDYFPPMDVSDTSYLPMDIPDPIATEPSWICPTAPTLYNNVATVQDLSLRETGVATYKNLSHTERHDFGMKYLLQEEKAKHQQKMDELRLEETEIEIERDHEKNRIRCLQIEVEILELGLKSRPHN